MIRALLIHRRAFIMHGHNGCQETWCISPGVSFDATQQGQTLGWRQIIDKNGLNPTFWGRFPSPIRHSPLGGPQACMRHPSWQAHGVSVSCCNLISISEVQTSGPAPALPQRNTDGGGAPRRRRAPRHHGVLQEGPEDGALRGLCGGIEVSPAAVRITRTLRGTPSEGTELALVEAINAKIIWKEDSSDCCCIFTVPPRKGGLYFLLQQVSCQWGSSLAVILRQSPSAFS